MKTINNRLEIVGLSGIMDTDHEDFHIEKLGRCYNGIEKRKKVYIIFQSKYGNADRWLFLRSTNTWIKAVCR